MARWRGKFAICTHVIVSLLNLEGDCHMDRVRGCRFLTPYQEGPHQKLSLKQKSKVFKQGGKLDCSRYSQVL